MEILWSTDIAQRDASDMVRAIRSNPTIFSEDLKIDPTPQTFLPLLLREKNTAGRRKFADRNVSTEAGEVFSVGVCQQKDIKDSFSNIAFCDTFEQVKLASYLGTSISQNLNTSKHLVSLRTGRLFLK